MTSGWVGEGERCLGEMTQQAVTVILAKNGGEQKCEWMYRLSGGKWSGAPAKSGREGGRVRSSALLPGSTEYWAEVETRLLVAPSRMMA